MISKFFRRFGHLIITIRRLSLKGTYTYYKLKFSMEKPVQKIRLRNGINVSVDKKSGDLCTFYEIFIHEDYKIQNNNHKLVSRILDIGANIGYFSIYAAYKYPQAKIFSFEPFPPSFKRLEENVASNRVHNIFAFPYAVSDKEGKAEFYTTDWAGCNTMVKGKFQEGHYSITKVNCISFKQIFEYVGDNYIDCAKMDCEGSEYPIILHSPGEVIRRIKEYVIEVHTDNIYKLNDLVERFKELGFETDIKDNILHTILSDKSLPLLLTT